MTRSYTLKLLHLLSVLCVLSVFTGSSFAGNLVLGELHFKGSSKAAKDSGVWIDGQYMGYLKELNGTKKILLLPGSHEVEVRQAGYRDFTQKVSMVPGIKQVVRVQMAKDTSVQYPRVTAEIKLEVEPFRAAVFVDGLLLGHVAEFQGAGKGLLVAPGERRITISLPGYRTFETVINLAPNQKFKLATNLIWDGVAENTQP
jgi:hypothetical protein